MAELPNYEFNENVYEPSDDTFLFIDALKDETNYLHSIRPTICLEIGSGSGAVTAYISSILESKSPAIYYTTDINILAVESTRKTANLNQLSRCEVLLADLSCCLRKRLHGNLDILLFNPPYVPTDSCEVGSRGIEASWAGGINGREVIDKVLPLAKELLSPNGVFYMVVVRENKPKSIEKIMLQYGFETTVIRSKRVFNESLSILKFVRVQSPILQHVE